MKLNANYWRLWTASVTSNLGDGVAMIAYPWLASTITRDGFKLGLVVLASRLPWLVFSLPAGVITDRLDRRKVMVWMDVFRAGITVFVAFVILANNDVLGAAAAAQVPVPNENLLLGMLILATFLFGMAEVLRDNTAQTILPAIVEKSQLEKANGRLWGAEMVMNSFAGPPLGGLLIGLALVVPFFFHSGTFVVSAILLLLIAGRFKPDGGGDQPTIRPSFWADLKEGFRWLWSHPLLRPLALILGMFNATSVMTAATYVLFVQEILGLEAAAFGLLMTAGAVGGVIGSQMAPAVARWLGKGTTLFVGMMVFIVSVAVTGLTSSAIVVWSMFLVSSFFVVVWNVITVSLRQRIIPDRLLGRVNSVYRFFGWGMMSVGAIIGGALVSLSDPIVGREWSLRSPFLAAAALQLLVLLYALPRINSRRIAEVEESVAAV
jgi:MFS family permease